MIPANFKKSVSKSSGASVKKQFIKSKLSKLRKAAMLKKSSSSDGIGGHSKETY